MSNLPSGTVTFLFTDIEGSTKLAQEHPDKWEDLRARHHEILQAAMDAYNGYVFQIIGDAFCVAFHTASAGLTAAIEAQRNLQNENWDTTPIKVRMGIHTGHAETDGNGYRGYLTMAKAQRVMSVGYGGQVLLSNASAELLHGELHDGIALRDMKEHRLKGLPEPEHLWQLVAPDLQSDFPSLQSLTEISNNLPIQLTSFIGREKAIEQIKKRLEKNRLVTLTGSGGVGKTRLSIQVASELLSQYPNGAWLVELAPVTDPALVMQVVCAALDVTPYGNAPILNTLVYYLRPKKVLLILDNCEHLIVACAQLCEVLLHACPNVWIIASSREALGIDGESSYRVPSLSLPNPKDGLQTIENSEAVNLFVERATTILPEFELTEANASVIARICQRLDGIALAIELAAARVRLLKVDQILARLDDTFHLLTGGSRTALPRHQTLRGTIDWSYNLLREEERTMLRYLSVFLGGWTLEAAEDVCIPLSHDGRWDRGEGDMLDLLTHLVDKSLVAVDLEHGDEPRYYLLETIRQYACEKLQSAGEEIEKRKYHLLFFLAFSEAAELKLQGTDMIFWLDRLEVEQGNLRAALEWAIESDPVLALRIIAALWFFWSRRASVSEGLRWAKMSLTRAEVLFQAQVQTDPETLLIWSKALAAEAALAYDSGDSQTSRVAAENSIDLSRKSNNLRTLAFALGVGAKANVLLGNIHEARVWAEEAIKICCQSGYKFELGLSLSALNMSADSQYLEESKDLRKEATSLLREGANQWMLALNIFDSAYVTEMQGDLTRAKAGFEEAARLFDQMRDRQYFTACRSMQAHMHRRHNQLQDALMIYRQTILSWRDLGHLAAVAHELECLAFIAMAQEQGEQAVKLLGTAEALREISNSPMTLEERTEYEKQVAGLHTSMDEEMFTSLWVQGRAMTMEKAIALAVERPHE